MRHIYLIGYRGCGKSSVGRKLAELLGTTSVDTDDIVEQMAGKTIREVFENDGEEAFRDMETKAIEFVSGSPERQIISLGGGAILREENRRLIKQGLVVWLQASAETLAVRITRDKTSGGRRPQLTAESSMLAEVKTVLAKRYPLYAECAQLQIDTEERSTYRVARQIQHWLRTARCD